MQADLDEKARELNKLLDFARNEHIQGRILLLEHTRERRAILRRFENEDPRIVDRALELRNAR